MDNELFDAIDEVMPKFNRLVTDGLAVTEMERVEEYIDQVWQCAAVDFPKGLVYKGYRRLTPDQEYHVNTHRTTNSPTMEIARSDVYMVAYQLALNGEDLPRECYVNLPIVYDGGIMHIRGSKYSICPVLADSSMSVGMDSIFISLLRDNITFRRLNHHFYENGRLVSAFVVWSALHHDVKNSVRPGGTRPLTTLAHYLFARQGVTETFEKYANAHVKVGNDTEITVQSYPLTDWVHFRSYGKPAGSGRNMNYVSSDVVIAVPIQEVTETVRNLIAGFFYVADYFPRRVTPEDIDEVYLWRALLGNAIWGFGGSEGRMVEQVNEHLSSLGRYVDNEARREFNEDGIHIDNLFDLFRYLIDNFTNRLIDSYEHLPSMYDRRLMVLRYVMRGLVASINLFMYRVSASQKKQLTAKDVSELLKDNIATNVILRINSGHGEVDTGVSSPGDNKFFKITSRIVKQVNSSGQRARNFSMTDPANALHPSIAQAGNFLTPSGSSPSGHERINPFVQLGPGRIVKQREETREFFDELEAQIRRTSAL